MNLPRAILSTLAYHDIFDYPLDLSEICDLLVKKKARCESIVRESENLRVAGKVGANNGYFFLKGRQKIVRMRKLRTKYSQKKLKRAAFFANLLKIIPSVKLVAVSGALSMRNSRKDDDVDLVIVTSKGLLWTTRFLANLLLSPFKRDPGGQRISDRACLNLFLDELDLSIRDRNIYTAHEICQMKVLWDRDSTYSKFLKANSWIREYLPNWQVSSQFTVHSSRKGSLRTTNYLLRTVETFLKKFQLWYMKKKLTTERISSTQLFFHPKGLKDEILYKYRKLLQKLVV